MLHLCGLEKTTFLDKAPHTAPSFPKNFFSSHYICFLEASTFYNMLVLTAVKMYNDSNKYRISCKSAKY